MMTHPIIAALFGGWEILLILAAIFVFVLTVTLIVGLVLLIVRAGQKKTHTFPPPMSPPTRPGG